MREEGSVFNVVGFRRQLVDLGKEGSGRDEGDVPAHNDRPGHFTSKDSTDCELAFERQLSNGAATDRPDGDHGAGHHVV